MATTVSQQEKSPGSNGRSTRKTGRFWHSSAPKAVSKHGSPADSSDHWQAWADHLAERKKPADLSKILGTKDSPLLWSLAAESLGGHTADFVQLLAQLRKPKPGQTAKIIETVEAWLAGTPEASSDTGHALECLAVAYALPRLSQRASAELWWDVLAYLQNIASDASRGQCEDPLVSQLYFGELPLVLAYKFPEVESCRALSGAAVDLLSENLVELLDGEGLPHADHLHLLRPLLACWTRCRAIGRERKSLKLHQDAKDQYEWLVRRALQFTRHDGTPVLATQPESLWQPGLFRAALELGGDASDEAAATLSLPGYKSSQRKKVNPLDLPEPAVNSEWSGMAMMRPNWTKDGFRLAVTYAGNRAKIELDGGCGRVFSGEWSLDVELGGKPLAARGEWEEICWLSDDDVDYLELEIDLDKNIRVQRQILFAREDRFLLLADTVLGRQSGEIAYRGRLPLAGEVRFVPAGDTQEGVLLAERNVGRVMPLALPEWRIDPRHGSLNEVDGALQLAQSANGSNLCCPLFIDLAPRRISKPFTWRRLTIAEEREIQPHDVAVGYRVQCNREQWLFYRSLAGPGSRSVLGQNFFCDFFAGRFDEEGETEELIQIE